MDLGKLCEPFRMLQSSSSRRSRVLQGYLGIIEVFWNPLYICVYCTCWFGALMSTSGVHAEHLHCVQQARCSAVGCQRAFKV